MTLYLFWNKLSDMLYKHILNTLLDTQWTALISYKFLNVISVSLRKYFISRNEFHKFHKPNMFEHFYLGVYSSDLVLRKIATCLCWMFDGTSYGAQLLIGL